MFFFIAMPAIYTSVIIFVMLLEYLAIICLDCYNKNTFLPLLASTVFDW